MNHPLQFIGKKINKKRAINRSPLYHIIYQLLLNDPVDRVSIGSFELKQVNTIWKLSE
jgi:hypothetical protein